MRYIVKSLSMTLSVCNNKNVADNFGLLDVLFIPLYILLSFTFMYCHLPITRLLVLQRYFSNYPKKKKKRCTCLITFMDCDYGGLLVHVCICKQLVHTCRSSAPKIRGHCSCVCKLIWPIVTESKIIHVDLTFTIKRSNL